MEDPISPPNEAESAPPLSVDDGDVLLDYEAEEPDEEQIEKVDIGQQVTEAQQLSPHKKEETEEPEEELEEGEVSDEDEETRKERLKPQPVCRFYSKGQCTWGASCRFVHPGVLDKGNYNMFAPPRPILPNEDPIEKIVEEEKASPVKEAVRRPETAWERGLRQAKEMKKLSQQRKETDIEYEEKRTTMSLTQAELDRENDYYTRPASPLRDPDDDFVDDDVINDVPPRLRRVAPPPPPDFQAGSRPTRRYPPLESSPPPRNRYRSPSPPPNRVRRVAPPRSPERGELGGPRHRRGDEWADPWMRGGEGRNNAAKPARKRSYSSGSSRSSSRSSSSGSRGSRSPKRRRRRGRRSSSVSSKSSKSRSRSSTPEGIPRRDRRSESPASKNAAPLQKRLMNLAKNIKKEPEEKRAKAANMSAADNELVRKRSSLSPSPPPINNKESGRRKRRSSSRSSRSSSSSPSPARRKRHTSNSLKPAVPPEEPIVVKNPPQQNAAQESLAMPKQQIRMTLKSSSAVSKAVSKNVLEKLGNDAAGAEILENAKAKREENKLKKAGEIKKEKKEKKEKKSAADRREELLKQLKAVENAIAKKRTKLKEEPGGGSK